ncbi:flagellar basal body-associated FliL family protein [Alkalibacterium sp. MB6]|uniref:flagellar basal body-associated FliL family protein n=1 Tax=Alkalibacterium sp. MB6 TaxID=2081965 RepID=UPI00137B479E|nr:flagellar basal body-associated FliL family protein [Alkalibacterium sp. MB6]
MAQEINAAKQNKGLKVAIIVLLLLTMLGTGVALGGLFFANQTEGAPSFLSRFSREEEVVEVTVPLEEFLINLRGESQRGQPIIKMELSLTSLNEGSAEIIGSKLAKVRDAVIHVVSSQSADTILEEADGQFVIKDEIKNRINQSLGEEIIEDVFFTNILIQR